MIGKFTQLGPSRRNQNSSCNIKWKSCVFQLCSRKSFRKKSKKLLLEHQVNEEALSEKNFSTAKKTQVSVIRSNQYPPGSILWENLCFFAVENISFKKQNNLLLQQPETEAALSWKSYPTNKKLHNLVLSEAISTLQVSYMGKMCFLTFCSQKSFIKVELEYIYRNQKLRQLCGRKRSID